MHNTNPFLHPVPVAGAEFTPASWEHIMSQNSDSVCAAEPHPVPSPDTNLTVRAGGDTLSQAPRSSADAVTR